MKITEITEGWGEYSNKSNHRMNKFKRQDEAPGDFGRWAQSAKQGVTQMGQNAPGAAARELGRVGSKIAGKLGFKGQQGKLQLKKVVGGVVNNFNRYLGQTGGKPTVGALKQYLTSLGIQNPVMEAPEQGDMFGGGADLGQRKAQAQANAQGKVTGATELSRDDLFRVITLNIQQAMKAGTLPKELQKFLG